jgi:hypothetical protein
VLSEIREKDYKGSEDDFIHASSAPPSRASQCSRRLAAGEAGTRESGGPKPVIDA